MQLILPEISQLDLAWLAGLLEGEGSFMRPPPSNPASPRVTVEMTDRDIIDRAARILQARVDPMRSRGNPEWKPSYRITLAGERAASLMRLLRPLMGMRRQGQIDAALSARDLVLQRPGIEARRERNLEIARRIAAGENGPELAREFGVTHQNIYYIAKKYRMAVCPSG